MRHLAFAALFALVSFASPAQAQESKAFPPDDCSPVAPFMSFTGPANGENTKCKTGQDVLYNAIPTCGAGQVVAHDGEKFYCKAETSVPSCRPNEFLSFDGQTYQCRSSGVATCGNNQVLTFNGTSYFCVNRDATIPVCGANQFLTYNGSYRCATVNTPTVPTCSADQVVRANGSQFYCDTVPPSTAPCPSGTLAVGQACVDRTLTSFTPDSSAAPGQLNGCHQSGWRACHSAGKRPATLQEIYEVCMRRLLPNNQWVNGTPNGSMNTADCGIDASTGTCFTNTVCATDR